MSLKPKVQPKIQQKNFGFEQSDESDAEDEPKEVKQPTKISKVVISKTTSVVSQTLSQTSTSNLKRPNIAEDVDEYDFAEHAKRACVQKVVLQRRTTTQKSQMPLASKNNSRRSYTHKWGSDDEEESTSNSKASPSSNGSDSSSSTGPKTSQIQQTTTTIKTDIRVVRKAKQCLDMGELKDIQDDLEYFMETLGSSDASINLKCLSMIKLAKRGIQFEFRQYLRTKPAIFQKLVGFLKDCFESQPLSICVATLFYMLSRDAGQFPAKIIPMKLLFEFLKQDKPATDSETKSYQAQCWEIIKDWKRDCENKKQRNILFDLNERNFTPSYLALVTMDYIMSRAPSQNKRLQMELLNIGFLQTLVAKIDKLVLSLKLLRNPTEEILLQHLCEIEHSFRICENGIMLEKRNQAFVVGHRNGILLFSCEKFLDYFCHEIPKHEAGSVLASKLFDVLELLFRLTMNASHSNEVCSLKLGQIGNFLSNSVSILANFAPRFAEQEKLIDFNLLLLGLLVNLTEKSAANRRKIYNMKLKAYKIENGKAVEEHEEQNALQFLTLLFVRHETMARTVDEELDNQLLEECPEEENGSDNEDSERLRRPNDMNEDEIINALNSAMKKATSHMQDSMMASYVGLLIGCLIQTDESLADKVRAFLPNSNFLGIIEQLERFREFVELTKIIDLSCITNVIQSLKIVNGQ